MKLLKTLQPMLELRMRQRSDAVLDAMKRALCAIEHLRNNDCTVFAVTIRHQHVVIEIDQPSDWMTGAIHIRRVRGDHRETIRVAKVMGCQVQWTITDWPELLGGRAS